MRRDYFTLEATGVQSEESDQPTLQIAYAGPIEELESQLRRGETQLGADEIDIAYRFQDSLEADEPKGVLAIADRVTGEYVLELNADANAVFSITDAVADGEDGETSYRVVIERGDDDEITTYEKSTLLIYDHDGELLRERSLIPSGVEI